MRRLVHSVRAVVLSLAVALLVPALTWAQATPIIPVSSDVATVKSDILLWAAALIGVALAIYAFRRVRGLVR